MSDGLHSPRQTRTRGFGRKAVLTLVLVLVALMAVEWLRTSWRESRQVTGDAQWIWADGPTRFGPPRAFYAVRDFELEETPPVASISVLGDEEYVLYVNGRAVGSNRYGSGAAPDRYVVTDYLRPGRNRLVAHLRSGSGNGAFLAVVWGGESDEPILVTDENWQIAQHRTPRMMNADAEVDWNGQAVVVAVPPDGRWGRTTVGAERPLLPDLVAGRGEVPARRILLPGRGWSGTTWRRFRRGAALGEHVVFDFGRSRTGYLTLRFPAGEPTVAVAYLGVLPPEPAARPPEVTVITSRGERRWVDTVPRTFRYALVVGLAEIRDAIVVRSDPQRLPPIVAGEQPAGAFGLEAPRLRTPAENVVWSKLEGFPSDTER